MYTSLIVSADDVDAETQKLIDGGRLFLPTSSELKPVYLTFNDEDGSTGLLPAAENVKPQTSEPAVGLQLPPTGSETGTGAARKDKRARPLQEKRAELETLLETNDASQPSVAKGAKSQRPPGGGAPLPPCAGEREAPEMEEPAAAAKVSRKRKAAPAKPGAKSAKPAAKSAKAPKGKSAAKAPAKGKAAPAKSKSAAKAPAKAAAKAASEKVRSLTPRSLTPRSLMPRSLAPRSLICARLPQVRTATISRGGDESFTRLRRVATLSGDDAVFNHPPGEGLQEGDRVEVLEGMKVKGTQMYKVDSKSGAPEDCGWVKAEYLSDWAEYEREDSLRAVDKSGDNSDDDDSDGSAQPPRCIARPLNTRREVSNSGE